MRRLRAMKTVAVRRAMPVSPVMRHQPLVRSLVAGSLTVEKARSAAERRV